MSVYFIRLKGSNYFKIGQASDPRARLKSLQTGSPHELELFATIPNGGFALESEIQSEYKLSQVRGEWFNLSELDVVDIASRHCAKQPLTFTAGDLLSAMDKEPMLTDLGFGFDDGLATHSQKHEEHIFSKRRKRLAKSRREFELCCQWFNMCTRAKKCKRSSYELKHIVEKYYSTYIPNGVLVTAAIHMNFKYDKYCSWPNALIAVEVPTAAVAFSANSQ